MGKKSELVLNGHYYKSITEASKATGISRERIARALSSSNSSNLSIQVRRKTGPKQENHRESDIEHILSIAELANVKHPSDWYELRTSQYDKNLKRRLDRSFNGSLLDALSKIYPEYNFEAKLFFKKPDGFWSQKNRKEHLLSLIDDPIDLDQFYYVNRSAIDPSMLSLHGSLIKQLRELFPEKVWYPWLFDNSPDWLLDDTEIELYFEWLAKKLKISSTDEWYGITQKAFLKNYGIGLLSRRFKNSPLLFLEYFMPQIDWQFWRFSKVRNRWKTSENQRKYIDWLGNELGIANPVDWYNVTEQDFKDNHGITLLGQYYSSNIADCIMTILKDEYPWEKIRFYRNEYKREVRLYGIISCGLPDYTVQFRYKHPEIRHPSSGRKVEFDIFIEGLDAAIEYQGEQHYGPVDRFDGVDPEEAQKNFEHRQKTDQEKREQSKLNNVNLLEIKYSDWDGSLDYVLKIFSEKFGVNIARETVLSNASARGFVDNEIIFESD